MTFLFSTSSTWRMDVPAVILMKITCLYGVPVKVGVLSFSSSKMMLIVDCVLLYGGKWSVAVTLKMTQENYCFVQTHFLKIVRKMNSNYKPHKLHHCTGISFQIILMSKSRFDSSNKLLIHFSESQPFCMTD